MANQGQATLFGVPTRSAVLFGVVVVVFFGLVVLTFDRGVGGATWTLRWIGAAVWVGFALYLGFRDIVAKKGGGPEDIDHIPFDRWTWIHTGAGALLGLWSVPFLLVVVPVTIAWEFFEKFVPGFGEKETLANRFVDVVGAWVGWFAFAAVVALLESKGMPLLLPADGAFLHF